jgi:lipopolysaccharide/colanic/teichoic acid biosynthesis glycosyltransferase
MAKTYIQGTKRVLFPKWHSEFAYTALDFILSVILLILSLPVFLLASFLVKIDSPGSVFYLQERYGKDKKRFMIYKFRTMAQESESDGCPVWGEEADPRSSFIGKILRITHIDELPQLVNVLKGEMSLVGPRPERPYFAEWFEVTVDNYKMRYNVKPGITGWSQVNGWRGNSSIEERTRFDIFYIQNRSVLFNFGILFLTFFTKPVKTVMDGELAEINYDLTFSQEEDICRDKMPLSVPIRKA